MRVESARTPFDDLPTVDETVRRVPLRAGWNVRVTWLTNLPLRALGRTIHENIIHEVNRASEPVW